LGAALLERHISPSPDAPSGLAHHLETEFKEAATALAVIIREKLNVRTCFEVRGGGEERRRGGGRWERRRGRRKGEGKLPPPSR
jgi:hypothetical protein